MHVVLLCFGRIMYFTEDFLLAIQIQWKFRFAVSQSLAIRPQQFMRTSSKGNIFRVTGPSWGNPPVTGGFPSQRPVTRTMLTNLC